MSIVSGISSRLCRRIWTLSAGDCVFVGERFVCVWVSYGFLRVTICLHSSLCCVCEILCEVLCTLPPCTGGVFVQTAPMFALGCHDDWVGWLARALPVWNGGTEQSAPEAPAYRSQRLTWGRADERWLSSPIHQNIWMEDLLLGGVENYLWWCCHPFGTSEWIGVVICVMQALLQLDKTIMKQYVRTDPWNMLCWALYLSTITLSEKTQVSEQ